MNIVVHVLVHACTCGATLGPGRRRRAGPEPREPPAAVRADSGPREGRSRAEQCKRGRLRGFTRRRSAVAPRERLPSAPPGDDAKEVTTMERILAAELHLHTGTHVHV